jgi:hypothetical protein
MAATQSFIIEIDRAMSYCFEDKVVLREMIADMLDDSSSHLAALQKAVDVHDGTMLIEVAQAVVASAEPLGLAPLRSCALFLMQLGDQLGSGNQHGAQAKWQEYVNLLSAEYVRLRSFYVEMFGGSS